MAAKTAQKPAASEDASSGARKVAILMVSLAKESAAAIMKQLDADAIETVTREIAALKNVTDEQRQEVIQQFHSVALARSHSEVGGLSYARSLLGQTLSKEEAERVIKQIEHQFYSKPFTFLHKAETDNLLMFIQDEHPQTIALILAHLTPDKASEILSGLPAEKQVEVVSRISRMEQTSPEVIKEVERGLETRVSGLMSDKSQRVGGVESVAE